MGRILIVSSSEKTAKALCELVGEAGDHQVYTVNSAEHAKQIIASADFDAVIINMPLPDEPGIALAERITLTTAACVMLIVKAELAGKVTERCEKSGIIILQKPVSKPVFFQTFKLACSMQNRMTGLKSENNQLKVKLDETKIIGRAKCVLIQYLGMTEPMAHRYIEKQAMDMRLAKTTIAENILKTYEY